MARRRRTRQQPPALVVLEALGLLWVLVALWAFFPLWSAILTQLLVGGMVSTMTHQPLAFAFPTIWLVPDAAPWLALITIALVLTWGWGVRSARQRHAAGKTLDELRALSPAAFEAWVAARFRDLGYTPRLTATTGDHEVDILADKPGERAVVQCKRYKGSVGEPVLRDLYGAMHAYGADRAYLATTGSLTRAATARARDKAALVVWDGEDLVRLSMRLATERPGRVDRDVVEAVTSAP